MAVQAGEDIAAGLALRIGTPEIVIIRIVAGGPLSMLFRSPIKRVKVSVQLIAVDGV